MPREFALLDAVVPTLFLAFLASIMLQTVLDRVMGRCGVYRQVWNPPLFRLSVFCCIFSASGLWVLR